ncbi:MAG TPA: hypothetical protein PKY72_06065 [Bacilli bacterium]|jgi:DNA-directed RNA polymerase subunit RPC12/RpoP|nr:hypothetical protein [Bacilli bacterium]HQO94223.1 hypothetical protein [Bacilli bacterium]HQQ39847.1 hypothetical protein [Bacilli bacterium]
MNWVQITMIIISGAILLSLLIALIKGIYLSKKRFICSECNQEFYPKWYQVMFEMHYFEYFRIKCPHCGKKKFHRCIDE